MVWGGPPVRRLTVPPATHISSWILALLLLLLVSLVSLLPLPLRPGIAEQEQEQEQEEQRKRRQSGLDGRSDSGCIRPMKTRFAVLLAAGLIGLVGCVSTVNERTTAGMPFIKDRVEGRYERSVDQVFDAAKAVINSNGALVNESTLYNETNMVKTIEGKVNQRNVWVRVEGVEPKITSVIVQTRTAGGGSDLDLAHEIEKQIALKLVH